MVLGWALRRSLVNTWERISSVWGPEILMMPSAPPGAVANAQIVEDISQTSNPIEDFRDQCIDGVLVLRIHLVGIPVGDDHATGHGTMTKESSETSDGR